MNDQVILLADILKCLRRYKVALFLGTMVFFLIGLFFAFSQPVKYTTRATFKEVRETRLSNRGMVEHLLQHVGVGSGFQSGHALKSHFLLKDVVETLGLQAKIIAEEGGQAWIQTIKNNWRAEQKRPLKENEPFVFRDVTYKGEKTKVFYVTFMTDDTFFIEDKNEQFLTKGTLHEPVSFKGICFTLVKTPKKKELHHPYLLKIAPTSLVVNHYQKSLDVTISRHDKAVYEFRLAQQNRREAEEMINLLMQRYRSYLKGESEKLASEQIAYLEKRKEELCLEMHGYLEEHVHYLKTHLGEKGFLNLGQHLDLLSARKQHHMDQLLSFDTEVKRLDNYNRSKEMAALPGEMGKLQKEVQGLKKQRDSINLAFVFQKQNEKRFLNPPFTPKESELYRCQRQLDDIHKEEEKISAFEKGKTEMLFSLLPASFLDLQKIQKERLQESTLEQVRFKKTALEDKVKKETGDQKELLQHELRLTRMQEAILKERLFYPKQEAASLQGIDRDTARALHAEYLKLRDEYEGKIKQLTFSIDHLDDPEFEFISLVGILPDGLSQKLARSIGELVQASRDKRHLSEKDLERLTRKIEKQKGDLKRHIQQTSELYGVQKNHLEEKMILIKGVLLDLLNQEMAVVHEQIHDQIEQKKGALEVDKELTEQRMHQVEEELKTIPDQWLKEHELSFRSEMNGKMLSSMMQLVESKNIEHHLMQVQSKPIDHAYSFGCPDPPRIRLFAILALFVGSVVSSMMILVYRFTKGFPLSLKNLKLQGKTVCGDLSDQETLRSLSSALTACKKGCVVTLLSPNEASSFAALLAEEQKEILYLSLKARATEKEGLYAFFKGECEEPPLYHLGAFDEVIVEKTIPLEWLKRKRFIHFLEEKKKTHDVILIHSNGKPHSSEAKFLSSLSDCIVLGAEDASHETLAVYDAFEKEGKTLVFGQA